MIYCGYTLREIPYVRKFRDKGLDLRKIAIDKYIFHSFLLNCEFKIREVEKVYVCITMESLYVYCYLASFVSLFIFTRCEDYHSICSY